MSEKTRKAIKKAFSELVKEKKSLENITVTDITTKADINRSTFYSHYNNIYEIAEEYKEEVLSVFHEMSQTSNADDYIEQIFLFIEKNINTFNLLLEGTGVILFVDHLASLATENLIQIENIKVHSEKALELQLALHGIADGIIKTILGKGDYPLWEVKECTKKLIAKILD